MSSHDPRSWSGKIRRAKSALSVDDMEDNHSPRFSHHNTAATTIAPSTPPKKSWERHYRTFLKKKTTTTNGDDSSDQQSDLLENSSTGSGSGSGSGSARGTFRLVPGSRRLVTKPPPPPPPQPPSSLDLPKPILAKTKSNSEIAVRGGSFFQSVFQKAPTPQHRKIKSADGLQRRIFSQSKSTDELDFTLRKGQDKTLSPTMSPKNVRFVKASYQHEIPPPSLPTALMTAQQQPITRSQLVSAFTANPLTLQPSAASTNFSTSQLSAALAASSLQHSTEIKKAFTEFHNSSQFATDSTSAYLGDDPSGHANSYFAQFNQMASANAASASSHRPKSSMRVSGLSRSVPLQTVTEDMVIQRPMLKPIQGPESWQPERRYLIAPAALSSCPPQVLANLSGTATHLTMDESVFGTIQLGRATLAYVGARTEPYGWSNCDLMLRQNYLLEYDTDAGMRGIPRGVAHLPYARAYPGDFGTSLELEFYASPCAKADKRILLIQVDSKDDRERWVECLNAAAQLAISDLYAFDELNPFGNGRYAAVYPARRLDHLDDASTQPNCAIKVIDKNEFWKRVLRGVERADTLVRESSVQATLTARCGRVPSFLQIRSLFETADHLVMELELLEGTDLFRHISARGTLVEAEAANIMKDILTSLDSMNRIGLAHRDIKPANILMANKEKDGVHVKVGDFGMSTFVGVDGLVRGRCGTPGYVAPEIFTAGVHGGYGNKVDVFSAGVTLYVMLCGYEPFYGESDMELIASNKIAEVEYPDSDWREISPSARDLVEKMLIRDPNQRISAADALKHIWIVDNASDSYDDVLDHSRSLKASDISRGAACTIS